MPRREAALTALCQISFSPLQISGGFSMDSKVPVENQITDFQLLLYVSQPCPGVKLALVVEQSSPRVIKCRTIHFNSVH